MKVNTISIILIIQMFFVISCRESPDEDAYSQYNINPPTLINANIYFITPYYGLEFEPGDTVRIKWISNSTLKFVDIYLLRKSTQKLILAENLSNSFEFSWVIPNEIPHSHHYHIKIVNQEKPQDFKISDRFSIYTR